MEQNIDFVIPWVDGGDENWIKEKELYLPKEGRQTDGSEHRYRDWENLRYWFRAVERYAPWVNRIYFVTWGHTPEWLNTSHKKLVLVNHRDYIPKQYLPTFSSHPIELNFHRIKGLSEQFVYFNDDMFLTKPVKPEDFFVNGLPKDCCIESAVMQDDYENPFAHILLNSCALVNMNYKKRDVIKKHWKKWFSFSYGLSAFRNLLMYPYGQFSSFKFFHIPSAFLKSSYQAVWELEPQILDAVCRNKFRSSFDVNQYVIKYYQFVTGTFAPQSPKIGKFFIPGRDKEEEILNAIRRQSYQMICINDDGREENFEEIKTKVIDSFQAALPEKSSFERG